MSASPLGDAAFLAVAVPATTIRNRRFAPMGLWTLPDCGKPRTASKSCAGASAHRFPQSLENRQTDAGFPQAPTGHSPLGIPLEARKD